MPAIENGLAGVRAVLERRRPLHPVYANQKKRNYMNKFFPAAV